VLALKAEGIDTGELIACARCEAWFGTTRELLTKKRHAKTHSTFMFSCSLLAEALYKVQYCDGLWSLSNIMCIGGGKLSVWTNGRPSWRD
jgi:hypothetical protein